jgi:hypothetical protein
LRPAQAKKFVRPYAKIKLGIVTHTCGPRYLGGRRIMVQGQLGQKQGSICCYTQ